MAILQICSSGSLMCKSEQNRFITHECCFPLITIFHLQILLLTNASVSYVCYLFHSEFLILYSAQWTSWVHHVYFPRTVYSACGNSLFLTEHHLLFELLALQWTALHLTDFLVIEPFASLLLHHNRIGKWKAVLGPPCIVGMILILFNL